MFSIAGAVLIGWLFLAATLRAQTQDSSLALPEPPFYIHPYSHSLAGLTIIAPFPDQFDQETSLYRIRVIISFDIYDSRDIDPVVGGMNVLKVASEGVTR